MIDTAPTYQNKPAPEVADLADRLNKLSEAASELSLCLTSEELKHRCSVVASGAQVAAALLVQMPHAIAAKPEIRHHAAISPRTISDGIETKLLYQLGWAALELGLKTEALAVLEMVGTLLHGKLGGLFLKWKVCWQWERLMKPPVCASQRWGKRQTPPQWPVQSSSHCGTSAGRHFGTA